MAQIKDLGSIAKKFATVTPGRTQEYADGVANPKKDWAQATAAAEANFEAGIQQAIAKKRFAAGVRKAGTGKWQEGAKTKGASRFGPGVAMAENAFSEGFAPFHQVIASTTLPPRFAKRDPRNLNRVAAIANALGKAKEARSGK